MQPPSHSAIAPALGYYYQAIYALKLLFESEDPDSFVSIETLDDVYFSDGVKRELHQLKHSMNHDTKITVKTDSLWNTLKIWCDYLKVNNPQDGHFTLSTVAKISDGSPLEALLNPCSDRNELEKALLEEADRVIVARDVIIASNEIKRKAGEKEESLPYETRIKGCLSFRNLTPLKRSFLINRIQLNPGIFSISEAREMVITNIRKTTQSNNHGPLAELILGWWDREAVKSLTKERQENLYFSELQEFISRKNKELFDDGFTDDAFDLELPPLTNPHPVHIKQLDVIDATPSQRRRSFDTEMKARIQRNFWITNSLPSANKLKKYDEVLVQEWAYKHEEIVEKKDTFSEEELKTQGRMLLDWSHEQSHLQIAPISSKYSNPDLVRGSYQMLSTTGLVGWHCDYINLISGTDENK